MLPGWLLPFPIFKHPVWLPPLLSCPTYPLWHLPWGSSGSLVLRSKSWNKWAALKAARRKEKAKGRMHQGSTHSKQHSKNNWKTLWVESSPSHEIALKIVIVKHRHILVLFTFSLTIYDSSFSSFLPRGPGGTWATTANWKLRFVCSHGAPGSGDGRRAVVP